MKFEKWIKFVPRPWSKEQVSKAFNAVDCSYGKDKEGRRRAEASAKEGTI